MPSAVKERPPVAAPTPVAVADQPLRQQQTSTFMPTLAIEILEDHLDRIECVALMLMNRLSPVDGTESEDVVSWRLSEVLCGLAGDARVLNSAREALGLPDYSDGLAGRQGGAA